MSGFSLIYFIVNTGEASKAVQYARKHGAKGGTISFGKGATSNRILDELGLSAVRKEIVSIIVEAEISSEVIKSVSRDMQFHKVNHGIAFSHSVSNVYGGRFLESDNEVMDNIPGNEVKRSMYKVIHVVVDKGKGEAAIF